MQIILKETVRKLGSMGDTVSVKKGFARNYLIPCKKAVIATGANLKILEQAKGEIRKQHAEQLKSAKQLLDLLKTIDVLPIFSNVSKDGKLFGSVTVKEIAAALMEKGIDINSKSIILSGAIKEAGEHEINMFLHSEVSHKLKIHILDVSKRV